MLPKHAEYQAFPHPELESAQRESNPHIRHGKAVGCRYIMGALAFTELSKIKSTGRDSNPRTHELFSANRSASKKGPKPSLGSCFKAYLPNPRVAIPPRLINSHFKGREQ